jgi:hypothetical protein
VAAQTDRHLVHHDFEGATECVSRLFRPVDGLTHGVGDEWIGAMNVVVIL